MAMCSQKLLLLLFLVILTHLFDETIAQDQGDIIETYCNYGYQVNYTSNSTYRTNLDAIPSFFSSNHSNFYNFSIGQDPDTVYVIGLCRGDATPDFCLSCLNESIINLRINCTSEKQAILWFDNCMLRYSDLPIFHTMQTLPNAYTYNTRLVSSNATQFNQVVLSLLARLQAEAAGSVGARKYATGTMAAPENTIYGLAECTPDLTSSQCNQCLAGVAQVLPQCCDGKIGGREVRPSCNFRYEIGQFYADYSDGGASVPGSPAPPPSGNKNNITRTVIIVVVSTACFVILVIVTFCIFRRRRKQRKAMDEYDPSYDEISLVQSLQYTFDTVRTATDDFSDTNKLGQGGFGAVYKGVLQNGQEIAVKRLSRDAGQGEIEFKNEVLLVAKLQHKCLVRLLGFCLHGTERLLMYEFVANTSLDHFLFDPVKRACLDWDMRYRIIRGVARGLLYLHEDSRLRIIHRDLKASNILLDKEMNPKISDFGMAKLFALDETQGNTSRVVGTFGYMPPEYMMNGEFSVKLDVFSFGVLLLEIVSGKKNNYLQRGENAENLSSYAWKNWKQGTASNVIDPMLTAGSVSATDMLRCIHISLLCIQENVVDRPTMASVVLMLSSSSITLAMPNPPAFFMQGSIITPEMQQSGWYSSMTGSSSQSESKAELVNFSANEASITELEPR